MCGALLGVEIRIACPKGYEPNSLVIKNAKEIYKNKNMLKITNDVNAAGKQMLFIRMFGPQWEKKIKRRKKKKNSAGILLIMI